MYETTMTNNHYPSRDKGGKYTPKGVWDFGGTENDVTATCSSAVKSREQRPFSPFVLFPAAP